MLASELIERLQEIMKKEGDSEVRIDFPNESCFLIIEDVVGKWYSGGYGYTVPSIYLVVAGN